MEADKCGTDGYGTKKVCEVLLIDETAYLFVYQYYGMLQNIYRSIMYFCLSLCEKALSEYLETKRLAFPRFYFVSSADLQDILSKGTQPKQICYITLTQSLHLTMSGAPAGSGGTGKTETTKDLGVMVYVFNCSELMDHKSVGNIYKGLAQTRTWGCFDEFYRNSVEVLSMVAVQVKSIQAAIRNKKERFLFPGENITLKHSVGIFITMNPGDAGSTELPENHKALFRPCAMVVPDIELICEITLVAEGFNDTWPLARKCITLYTLWSCFPNRQVSRR
ncbi:dynein heavy chain 11, axonemal-like [Xenopus laevis]|uniref:Dynein heavy chain 11, axonemal-like n=1 Tax=Xenopus laevis TaxID=8355 RepID=A0A8J1L5K0_XENLA|nr:dynein heavy chain 11, axonemal-like [Xenopus laevis]